MSGHVDLALAAEICRVKPETVRRWVYDKKVTQYRDGFDVDELLDWRDRRDPDALYSRAGLRPADRPDDTRHVQRRTDDR